MRKRATKIGEIVQSAGIKYRCIQSCRNSGCRHCSTNLRHTKNPPPGELWCKKSKDVRFNCHPAIRSDGKYTNFIAISTKK